MLGAGALYAEFGGGAYLFMTALSAIGLLGALRLVKSDGQRHFRIMAGRHRSRRET